MAGSSSGYTKRNMLKRDRESRWIRSARRENRTADNISDPAGTAS